ncbi:MAG: hypothetical protein PHE56_01905, partial [Bacteroidales bacterium]|nr:hypothetical protein [Bacteroidales bacterium]
METHLQNPDTNQRKTRQFYMISRHFPTLLTIIVGMILFNLSTELKAQSGFCDPTVPFQTVDLSSSPDATWTSPVIVRQDHCCGTGNPDRCLEFEITLHPDAIAINFQIASGAV